MGRGLVVVLALLAPVEALAACRGVSQEVCDGMARRDHDAAVETQMRIQSQEQAETNRRLESIGRDLDSITASERYRRRNY